MPCRHTAVREQFFKSELCAFHLRGRCRKGALCEFAHDASELSQRPDLTKTSLCTLWVEGRCSKTAESCQFAHGEVDKRRTLAWFEEDVCPIEDYVGYNVSPNAPLNLLAVLNAYEKCNVSLVEMTSALMHGFATDLNKCEDCISLALERILTRAMPEQYED